MDTVTISTVLKYYKRKEIQEAIVECAKNKEVVGSFKGEGFGKRPDVLMYANDVLEQVKNGVTSFHCSEELWSNPLGIKTEMNKRNIERLRIGWDLVLDIDCKELEYSKIGAYLVVEALKHHGIKSISAKYSGNHGFHIAVPFEALPREVNGQLIKDMFPDAPRKIALYLKEMISKHLSKMLLEKEDVDVISTNIKKTKEELLINGIFDPFKVLDIDTILISPRHLYRMPYSLNEKAGLVSLPINPYKILEFDKNSAIPDIVRVNEFKFLDRSNIVPNEANTLVIQAFDYKPSIGDVKLLARKEYEEIPANAIPAEMFPPCIKLILNGLKDGRKRGLFILVNFLRSTGWEYDKIEELLEEWNKRNSELLREVIWKGQLRHHKQNKKNVLPPNCNNQMYMLGIGVCQPDMLCRKIKNPAQYAKLKAKLANKPERKWSVDKKEEMKKLREERKKFKEEVKRKRESGELS